MIEFAHKRLDAMMYDIKRILREMATQEARSRILSDQTKLRMRHCYNSYNSAYESKSQCMKSKRTKNR